MRQEYVQYISQRFEKARVKTEPFPHLILDEVLPPDLYDEMDRSTPSKLQWLFAALVASFRRPWSEFEARKRLSHTYFSQPVLSLNNRTGTPTLVNQSRLWKERYFPYVDFIHQQIIGAFQDHLQEYLKQLVDWSLYPKDTGFNTLEYEFCFRTKGWCIPPHTHHLMQALQWMLYFPLPNSDEKQGTQLYRIARPKTIETKDLFGTTWFNQEGEVELAVSVPYKKNCLISFLNTPRAVHGSSYMRGAPARRYLFVGEWFNKPHNVAGPGTLQVSNNNFVFNA